MSQAVNPKVSPGSNEATILETLKSKLLPPQSRWTLTHSGEGIQRAFKFKTFKSAWEFMNRVAEECKATRHHPEWSNVYNTVFVRWTTHSPKGLSEKDVTMALICDERAKELGEVLPKEGEEVDAGGRIEALAGLGVEKAGDCCVPGKQKKG